MIEALKLKMMYLAERQKLIASNVANINTPGAKTADLEPFGFDKVRKRLKLAVTDADHLPGGVRTNFLPYKPLDTPVKLDGNDISLENETKKLNNSNLEHQQVVGVYNKLMSIYRMASQSERKG